MCGIAGILSLDGFPVVDLSYWTLLHRGPDDAGAYRDHGISLFHTRLAILDRSPAGQQPMFNENRTLVLIFNGEIYNYLELRRTLKDDGHTFTSGTDSEVILHLYEDHGLDFLRFLDGMFAFAIWDTKKRRLVLARDRLGVKPLTYQVDAHAFRFASEAKAILSDPSVPREPNLSAIGHYLTFGYVPSPHSAFRGFSQLPPAHYLVIKEGAVGSPVRYWDIDRNQKHGSFRLDQEQSIRTMLLLATAKRMVADVPVGVLLSGGIDSSAVVWAMRELGHTPKTFCMGFSDPAFDERHAARIVSRFFRTTHHEFEASEDDLDFLLYLLTEHYDEPFADSSAVPTLLLAGEVSKHVKVVLTGDGGDEAFGGYTRYTYQKSASYAVRRVESQVYASPFCMFHGKRWDEITTPEFREQVPRDSCELLASYFEASTGVDPVDRAMDVDTRLYLPDDLCVKMDRATMAFGLEARSPFLDHHIVEYAAQIPSQKKVVWLGTKRILKRALLEKLPCEIINRPKTGFGAPVNAWFRGPLLDMIQDIVEKSSARGWLSKKAMQALVHEHVCGQARNGAYLWYILMLELWAQRWIDGKVTDAGGTRRKGSR